MRWLSANKSYIGLASVLIIAVLSFALAPGFWAKLALHAGNFYFNVEGDGVYNLDKARKYFEIALKLDPKVPDAWHQLSRIDFLRGDFYTALTNINKQIELHGENFMASFYVRGLIQGYMCKISAAEEDFKKFLEWDSQNWAALNDLAWIYFQQGEYEKAEEASRQGLDVAPQNPWLLNSLGVSLLNQGAKAEAREVFLKAQNYVALLTEKEWQKAYPGNDPKLADHGIENIKKIIAANLELASD